MEARLEALRAAGIERMTVQHFRDLSEMTGRSRPWIYMVLGTLVDEGRLVDDSRGGQAVWRFAA
ncbi:hypothetical protein FNV66_00665 (plasmid) [Streptomyces sp. S1D4-14]|nr:hypothetical protein FNV66_00665 [Streptomyces sp. S1D4-14]